MITTNSIGYCGFVSIKKMRGKTIVSLYNIHNNGTDYLFQMLAGTLCGYNKLADRPLYLDLGNTEAGTYTSAIATRVPLVSSYVENLRLDKESIAKVAAKFSANIPARTMRATKPVNTFALYSTYSMNDNRTHLLAEVRLPEESQLIVDQTDSQHSYVIEWVMTFTNQVINVGEN